MQTNFMSKWKFNTVTMAPSPHHSDRMVARTRRTPPLTCNYTCTRLSTYIYMYTNNYMVSLCKCVVDVPFTEQSILCQQCITVKVWCILWAAVTPEWHKFELLRWARVHICDFDGLIWEINKQYSILTEFISYGHGCRYPTYSKNNKE